MDHLFFHQRGSVFVEYVLIIGLIAILSVSNINSLRSSLETLISNISTEIDDVATSVAL